MIDLLNGKQKLKEKGKQMTDEAKMKNGYAKLACATTQAVLLKSSILSNRLGIGR